MLSIHKEYPYYDATDKGQNDARLLTDVEAVNLSQSIECCASYPHGYKTCYGNAPTFPVLAFPSNDRGSHGYMKCRELI